MKNINNDEIEGKLQNKGGVISEPHNLQQCPYDIAIKCIMDEECLGCEHYKGE